MIILTGSEGFIGRNFQKALPSDIIKIDLHNCLDFISKFDDWERVDLILHQGAISSTTETDIDKIHKYNVQYSISLFEKAIQYGIPVKYASSASLYGNFRDHVNPLNYYAISKLQVDYWVLDNIKRFSSIQGFRYFNVYGEGEQCKGDQASPVSKFVNQIKATGKLKLFEGSDFLYRDFICVNDLVDIVLNNNKSSGIYDLGTSNPRSFKHVADAVIKKHGGEIEYIPFPDHLKGKYQFYTSAAREWGDYKFTTIEEYLA